MEIGNLTLVAEHRGGVHSSTEAQCDLPPILLQKLARLSDADLSALAAFARKQDKATEKWVTKKLESLDEASERQQSRALAAIADSAELEARAESGCVTLCLQNVLDPILVRRELNSARPGSSEDNFAFSAACLAAEALGFDYPQLTLCRSEAPRTYLGDVQGHGTVIGLPRGPKVQHADLAQLAETVSHLVTGYEGLSHFTLLVVSPDGGGHVPRSPSVFSLRHEIMSTLKGELADCGIEEGLKSDDTVKFSYVGGGTHDGAFVLVTEGCSDSAHAENAGVVLGLIARYWAGWIAKGEMPKIVGSARVRNSRTVLQQVFGEEFPVGMWRDPLDIAWDHATRELDTVPATNEALLTELGLRRCALTEELFAAACDPDVSATQARSMVTYFAVTLLYEVFGTDPFAQLTWRNSSGSTQSRSEFWAVGGSKAPVPISLGNLRLDACAALEDQFNGAPIQEGWMRLYHGSTKISIGSIIDHSIDPDALTRDAGTDLGRGFYTTPDLWYAVKRAGVNGAVIAFDVPQDELERIKETISYPEPWTEIVNSFIQNTRRRPRLIKPVAAGRISTRSSGQIGFEVDPQGNPAVQYVFRLDGGVTWFNNNALLVSAIGSN